MLCATASGLCCGADAQGGDLDVCTLAQFLLCSRCHFFPLLMPELCSVLGVGSRVSGKGRPETPPCSWCQVWCMANAGTSHRETWGQGMKQVCRSSAPLPLPFSLITYSFKRAKLDFCISKGSVFLQYICITFFIIAHLSTFLALVTQEFLNSLSV